jgi:hypothetical protein
MSESRKGTNNKGRQHSCPSRVLSVLVFLVVFGASCSLHPSVFLVVPGVRYASCCLSGCSWESLMPSHSPSVPRGVVTRLAITDACGCVRYCRVCRLPLLAVASVACCRGCRVRRCCRVRCLLSCPSFVVASVTCCCVRRCYQLPLALLRRSSSRSCGARLRALVALVFALLFALVFALLWRSSSRSCSRSSSRSCSRSSSRSCGARLLVVGCH